MTTETDSKRRFTIVGDGLTVDLAAPGHSTVADALASAGVAFAPDRHALLTRAGKRLEVHLPVGELPDGSLLAVIDLTARPSGAAKSRSKDAGRVSHGGSWLIVAAVGLLLTVAGLSLLGADVDLLEVKHRWWVAAAIVATTALGSIAWSRRADAGDASHAPGLAGVALIGLAAGTLLAPHSAGGVTLGIALGLACAGLTAVLVSLAASSAQLRATGGTTAVILLAAAAVWAIATALHLPAALAAGVCLGAVPPAMRAVPEFLLHLDEGYSISYRHFMQNRWTVRGVIPPDPGPVEPARIQDELEASRARRVAATVTLACIGIGATVVLLADRGGSLIERVGTLAVIAAAVLALGLAPRRANETTVRWVPRAAAAVIALLGVIDVAANHGQTVRLIVASSLLGLGLLCAWLIVPAARGFASLVVSRLGDMIEGMAVALALPFGLLAGGIVTALREMVAS